ncbi:MAG: hypothetical protein P8P30_05570 [Rickettsiales bacterium]|nr:hypothetical protein [Rickettsiales bacterium]
MGFSSRRGRPKQKREDVDKGTAELRKKRRLNLTTEPLDWLREHELISSKQHWCGLHFRWLYTLRYGSTTPQSLDAAREKGILHKQDDESWKREREDEWKDATAHLRRNHLLEITLKYCIYQQNTPHSWQQRSHCAYNSIADLNHSLSFLEKLWCRRISFD